MRIKPFLWSGANSVFEREQTAAELANKLATQREASRDAQQIVIAHSHGGNIALKALQYLEARGAADTPMDVPIGVATLATPFLQIYRVPENSSRSEAYFNIAFVFGCLLWIFVVAWFQFGNGFLAYGVGTGIAGRELSGDPSALEALRRSTAPRPTRRTGSKPRPNMR